MFCLRTYDIQGEIQTQSLLNTEYEKRALLAGLLTVQKYYSWRPETPQPYRETSDIKRLYSEEGRGDGGVEKTT